MNVPKDYEEFFALLNKEKIRYLIVGAYAVAYHAQPRFTGDIDIFVEMNRTNAEYLSTVVRKFGKQSVWYISKKDLIRNKRSSGRTRDLLDLELITKGRKSQRTSMQKLS